MNTNITSEANEIITLGDDTNSNDEAAESEEETESPESVDDDVVVVENEEEGNIVRSSSEDDDQQEVGDEIIAIQQSHILPGVNEVSEVLNTDVSQPHQDFPESSHPTISFEPGPATSQNTSLADFQPSGTNRRQAVVNSRDSCQYHSPKRRRIHSTEKTTVKNSNKAAASIDAEEEDDDGNCCSICFEPWTNSGNHRLASLKCGHLFGLGCIQKWLKGQGGKCPQCNEKAKHKDIRVIYAKTVMMIDTTERDRALKDLERERELRRQSELEAAQSRLHCQQVANQVRLLQEEIDRLRAELNILRSQKGALSLSSTSQAGLSLSQRQSQSSHLPGQFIFDKTVKIWEGGQCRVLAYSPSIAALVISQPSSSSLFPGFGIKKLNTLDFKTSSYLTLHQKAIRCIAFHPEVDDGMLLSCSMDKTVKLTSVITSSVVQIYNLAFPAWSCEWHSEDPNYFYVGQQSGSVYEFDIRNTAEHVRELNSEGSKSPVVSLQHVPHDITSAFRPGGLMVGQLDRISFYENKPENESRLHILPLEGNLTSLCMERPTRHMLASFRPTSKHPTVRHQVCELSSTTTDGGQSMISCNPVQTFHGGRSQSVLAHTLLTHHVGDPSRLLVVAGDEPSESIHIWDAASNRLFQRLPVEGIPLDFTHFVINNQDYLVGLTEKKLKVYRWN